jgi:undecaprenyl-diphosphatase
MYELLNSLSEDTNTFSLVETTVATVTAFVIGYAVIAWLMKFVQTKSFMPFVVYRVLLGSLILVLLSTGTISA